MLVARSLFILLSLLVASSALAQPEPRVLMIMSSNDKLGNTGQTTGTWLEELVEPYRIFRKAGYKVTIASIKGGNAPIDPESLSTKSGKQYTADAALQAKVATTVAIAKVTAKDYDAVFLVGGHGAPWDFPGNRKLEKVVSETFSANKVVGAVCHGTLGLPKDVVKGRTVTGFSDAEDKAERIEKIVPMSTQKRLAGFGGKYIKHRLNYAARSVRDGNLVTGQNPASSRGTASKMVQALKRNRSRGRR